MTPSRFRALDGLRGLLALVVALHHSRLSTHVPYGYLAVDFFFMLSGFVLFHAYSRKDCGLWDFAIARFARLWPVHAVLIIILSIAYPALQLLPPVYQEMRAEIALHDLLLLTTVIVMPQAPWGFNGVSWSISVEMYAGFLVFAYVFWRAAPIVPLAIGCIAYGAVLAKIGNLHGVFEYVFQPWTAGFLRGIGGLSLGVGLYSLFLRYGHVLNDRPRMLSSLQAGTFLGAGFIFTTQTSWAAPLFLPIAALLVLVFASKTPLSKILATYPFRILGALSFTFYLCHQPVFWVTPDLDFSNVYLTTAAQIGLALIVAVVLHRVIEKPANKAILQWWKRRKFRRSIFSDRRHNFA